MGEPDTPLSEHDSVELLVAVHGEDREGQDCTFGPGASGAIVNVSPDREWYLVE